MSIFDDITSSLYEISYLKTYNEENSSGQEIAPFFYPNDISYFEVDESQSNEKWMVNPELLLNNNFDFGLEIPDILKDILASATLVIAAMAVPGASIGLGIGAAFGLFGTIVQAASEEDTFMHRIGEFAVKVNKAMLYTTTSLAFGQLLGGGIYASILGSGIASVFNSMYNIVEEDISYAIIDRPIDSISSSGIDKHSCVRYEDGALVLDALLQKASVKMMGRFSKEIVKIGLDTILAPIMGELSYPAQIVMDMVQSTIKNFTSNTIENIMNNGIENQLHTADRDIVMASTKAVSKRLLEAFIETPLHGNIKDYQYGISAISTFTTVLVKTIYEGYWDGYFPDTQGRNLDLAFYPDDNDTVAG